MSFKQITKKAAAIAITVGDWYVTGNRLSMHAYRGESEDLRIIDEEVKRFNQRAHNRYMEASK